MNGIAVVLMSDKHTHKLIRAAKLYMMMLTMSQVFQNSFTVDTLQTLLTRNEVINQYNPCHVNLILSLDILLIAFHF